MEKLFIRCSIFKNGNAENNFVSCDFFLSQLRFHCAELKFETLNKAFLAWEDLWTNSRNYLPFLKDCFLYFIHEPPFVNICTEVIKIYYILLFFFTQRQQS